MKKRDPLIWSNIPDVDEILRGLVLSIQKKNPLLRVDKEFYQNLKPGPGQLLFPCMAIIQEQSEKIEIMSSQIKSQETLIHLTEGMINRMLTEINEQKEIIIDLSSQLKSIQSLIQEINDPPTKRNRASLSAPICYNISEDNILQSGMLPEDSCLQFGSFSSDKDLPSFSNSLNFTPLEF